MMANFSDDLTELLVPDVPGTGLRYSQGELIDWDPETFENTVLWRGVSLQNLPVLPSVDALSFRPGDILGMLGWNPNGGAASWWILGKVDVPPLDDPVAIHGGAIRVFNGDGILIAILGDDPDGFSGLTVLSSASGDALVRLGELEGRLPGAPVEGLELLEDGRLTFLAPDNTVLGGIGPIRDPSGSVVGRGMFVEQLNGFDIMRARTVNPDGSGGGQFVVGQLGQTGSQFVQLNARNDGMFLNSENGNVNINPTGVGRFGLVSQGGSPGWPTGTGLPLHRLTDGSGSVVVNTSSRRFKADIKDFSVNPRTVLDLKPRTWRDRSAVEKDPDTDHWQVGFIAEELDQIGLTAFVDYDSNGEPLSIQYERLTVALLEVVKEQDQRLANVESRLDDLDGLSKLSGQATSVETTPLPKRVAKPAPVHPPEDVSGG